MIVPFHVSEMLRRVRQRIAGTGALPDMAPRPEGSRSLRMSPRVTADTVARLHRDLGLDAESADRLFDSRAQADLPHYAANIENMIGTVSLPVGVIGPLRINGVNAVGDYPVPMATSEAALVASYGRGARAANKAGGIGTAVLYEGVLRSPAFVFETLLQAGQFVDWVVTEADLLKARAEDTTRHGKLVSLEPVIDNNVVFLLCRYTTGDAAGQNMVTIATEALCRHVAAHCPIQPRNWYVEGNFSGDKKASSLGMITGRGRKVSASVVLPEAVVETTLGTTMEAMLDYGRVANLGALLSGQFGAQAHFANGLAAVYIATGQDAACVAESAVGYTRMERRDTGLFCSVTMPSILVGTVGGGTGLPAQAACLDLMGLRGAGHGEALAEVVAATCLCGEISIVAAMASGTFASAHEKLARLR
ncbi:hydroxymethylglutaryl-CoA reductase [Mameliella sp. AT18]|uniref:hydroxymethylglutaryl-CoA reductase n=1 Tax=Mameliella sp. AT18 TaxID=3028385 RepID=UPI00084110EB|nr:hydroxymethylglutaryl-CoA reductase [Mameliella sp. AT18]MDD9728771.1 hydroxymethylglutaryl-CoA reductase [Mameliella sp. AT18]ODM45669.1 3-hydroxy-3-methylglutaryl-CoA reductase [Ruegeria sp. PBVC088]